MSAPQVGCLLNRLAGADAAEWRRLIARAEAAGLDHIAVSDHISFRTGAGADGLLAASTVLGVSGRLSRQHRRLPPPAAAPRAGGTAAC